MDGEDLYMISDNVDYFKWTGNQNDYIHADLCFLNLKHDLKSIYLKHTEGLLGLFCLHRCQIS